MKACVLTFSPRSGTGTQTISGVIDVDGNPFAGKLFIFQSAYAVANTITAASFPDNLYMDSRGIDTGSVRSSRVVAEEEFLSGVLFKDMSGAESLGDASLLDFTSQPSFGGLVKRRAKITSVASGSFTLTYAQNDRTGDVVHVTVLGGDDLTIDLPASLTNGTKTVVGPPKGVLIFPAPNLAASGATSTGTGGQTVAWGWDTPAGVRGTMTYHTVNQGSQFNAQHTDAMALNISDVGVLSSNRPVVSAWGATSITIAGEVSGLPNSTPVVFSGSNIVTAAGRIAQPTTTGVQVVTTGINAKWIMFLAGGYAASTDVQTPSVQTVLGWAAGTGQAGFWTGERQASGLSGPYYGARYLSTNSVLRFGTPDRLSTTFDSIASVTNMSPTGTVLLNWSAVDGTERAIEWFAIGEAASSGPAYTTRSLVRRRVRRSPVTWAEHDGLQTRISVSLFAVDMQPATATADTPDPQVMVRASKDGGHTWTDWRQMSAGAVGAYTTRLNAWRWGTGRQWVFEVATSDPVTYNLINAYMHAEPGQS